MKARSGTGEDAMKTYSGTRTIDGLRVTVDGAPLGEHLEVGQFSDAGFEWGYVGDAPKQLALALLCESLGDPQAALAQADGFMQDVVSILDNDWDLTDADIQAALKKG